MSIDLKIYEIDKFWEKMPNLILETDHMSCSIL